MKQVLHSLLLWLVFVPVVTKAMPDDKTISYIQNLIIDLKLSEAGRQIYAQSKKAPIQTAWLNGYLTFINYQTTTVDVSLSETTSFIDEQGRIIRKLKDGGDYPFYQADLFLMNAFIHFQNQEYFSALNNYLKARKQIERCQKLYAREPNCHKFQLIDWAAQAWIKENIPFSTVNPTTDNFRLQFEKRVHHLLASKEITEPQKREIALLAGLLHPYFESNSAHSFQFIQSYYCHKNLKGPLEYFVYAKAATKAAQPEIAVEVLNRAINKGFANRFNRLNLMIGNLLANKQEAKATLFLERYIAQQKNLKGVLYAQLKLLWVHLINKNQQAFRKLKQNLVKPANLSFEMDKQADYELMDSANWTRELILSRQLFDAAYYKQSLNALLKSRNELETYNQNQRLTYAYRIARAYHALKEYDKALAFYKIVIASGLDKSYYYPAYAAFFAGEIYSLTNDTDQSQHYYNRCLNLDSPIYKTTIHHLAKSKRH